jgi:thiosulfate reductase cytochrome b subunit
MTVSIDTARNAASAYRRTSAIHPRIVRFTHWINALAMIVMIMSGWQIHNAYPTMPFLFPDVLTLGSGLAVALQWHLAAMWLLGINGVIYVAYGIASGRFRRKLLPIRPSEVVHDVRAALTGRLRHENPAAYNAAQRLLYAGVIGTGVLIVASGLAIWKPVQFRVLTTFLGDFDNARIIHFAAMSAIVLFLILHVVMALIVPSTIRAMIFGR